jgi:hypothetical protein
MIDLGKKTLVRRLSFVLGMRKIVQRDHPMIGQGKMGRKTFNICFAKTGS